MLRVGREGIERIKEEEWGLERGETEVSER